ncbi:MAG: hypothetical protein ACPGWR_21010 [Ardenticatenaceae bacterium]
MIEYGGGRAGPHEEGWLRAGYKRDEVEPLRQELLSHNDVGRVQRAMRKLGIRISRAIIQAVKDYNFDSQGVGFVYGNYRAWRRLATGKGTIGDAIYLIHEVAEVEELLRIRQQTNFDFMKREFKTEKEVRQWRSDFRRYYLQSHSKALEAEYEFVAKQVIDVTNASVKISKLQAAAIDPTRDEEALSYLLVDGIQMGEHYNFPAWKRRANEVVSLSKSTQKRLAYYQKEVTLENLIRFVKKIPL